MTANNRIVGDDYPHHITSRVDDGYRARGSRSCSASASATRSRTSSACSSTSTRSRASETVHRLSRLHPQRPARAARDRAAEELGRHARPRHDRGHDLPRRSRSHFARLVSRGRDRRRATRRALAEQVAARLYAVVSSPWRFQARLLELWDEGDSRADSAAARGTRSRWRRCRAALDELEQRFGHDPAGWRWGRVHGVEFAHPLAEGKGRTSKLLDRAAFAPPTRRRRQETVCQIGFVPHDGDFTGIWAPSYRMLADLGGPSRSRWQHMTGQSGHPGSRHYDDLLEGWHAGRSYEFGRPVVDALRLDPAARLPPACRRAATRSRCPTTSSSAFLEEQRVVSVATIGPHGPPAPDAALVRAPRAPMLLGWTYAQVAEGEEPRARPARHAPGRGRRAVPRAARRDDGVRRGDRARAGRGRELRRGAVRALSARRSAPEVERDDRASRRQKRVGLRSRPTRIVSWDHASSGGTY